MKQEPRQQADSYAQTIKKADNLFMEEEFEEAIQIYQEALIIKPNSLEVLNKLGQAFCYVEEFEEAVGYFKQAIELRPQSPEAYFNLGVTYDLIEKFDEAIQCYEKLTVLTPNDADVFYNLGADYDFLGQPDKALPYYQQALKLYPKMEEAAHNIAVIYTQKGTDLLLGQKEIHEIISVYKQALKVLKNKDTFFQIMNDFVLPQTKDIPKLHEKYLKIVEELKGVQ